MKPRKEAKYPEITLGETVCEKLQDIFCKNRPWPESHKQIVQQFTVLKEIMRKIYADKSDLDILRELSRYSRNDLCDVFGYQV